MYVCVKDRESERERMCHREMGEEEMGERTRRYGLVDFNEGN